MRVWQRRGHGWGERLLGLALACVAGTGGAARAASPDAYFRSASDANVYVAPVASSIAKVAVLPFKAPTELIGSSVSDIFVTELLRTRRYTLVERGQIDRVLGETEFALSGLSESAAIEAGRMMGAEGVILGTVDEYATVAHRGRSYPVVGASIRLIDCDTGRVMWSVGHARRSESPLDTLSGHARAVVHEMVSGLVQNWDVQRQVAEELDDARGDRDRPDDPVFGDEPAEPEPEPIPAPPPPDIPGSFTISDLGLREVALKWVPPADRSVQYRVERAGSPDGPFTALATVPAARGAYADLGAKNAPLQDSATYYYRLVAVGRDRQESAPSETMESLTAPPPDPPGEVWAEAPAGRAVRLEWAASGSEGVVRYLVERAPEADGDYAEVGESSATDFSEGGTAESPLADSTAYFYRVRAVNRVGAVGEPSAPVEIATRPPPTPPDGLAAESLQVRCVPLSWAVHPDEDVVRYDVYRAEAEDGPFELIGSSAGRENCAYLDGGPEPGRLEDDRAYFYRVRAVNSVTAESVDSEVAAAATRPPPPAVEGLAAVTGLPRRVELEWNMSADEKVVGYDVERAEAGGDFLRIARVAGRETTRHEDAGDEASRFMRASVKTPLQDGAAYAYRVRAVNAAEAASVWCEPVEAVTKVVPRAPAGLKASEGRPGVIGVVWKANPEEDIARYVVEYSAAADRGFAEAGQVAADEPLGLKQEALPPDLERHYRVKAVDADGLESAWSESVSGTTKPRPGAPADLALEWTADGAFLRWTAPPQKDVARYRILNKKLFGPEEIATASAAEFFFPAEVLAQKKVLSVVAVDEDGLESPASAPLAVSPRRAAPSGDNP